MLVDSFILINLLSPFYELSDLDFFIKFTFGEVLNHSLLCANVDLDQASTLDLYYLQMSFIIYSLLIGPL